MAEAAETAPETPAKKSKKPLLIGLALMLAAAGGGFYVTSSGLLPGHGKQVDSAAPEPLPDVAYVPVEPLVISLGDGSPRRYLHFSAQIEVGAAHVEEVTHIMPRVMDVLNSYLRAVDARDLEAPGALVKLRAQLLRRIRMVAGEARVHDLLVTEFVIN
ncbi:MAG: flagellar basal body-associated FliL family protein [Defluviimonas sp.]|uniref:flagellar basal body-associated FliL family protein n=1 Tax=Albidovulum sp. TaxID=1872424 RepID=UPI002A2C1747|nr:flagellar basal body-associated FliL family protein [Defluviimonas sp.]